MRRLFTSLLPIAALLSACHGAASQPTPKTPDVAVRVAIVDRLALARSTRAVGRLAHKRSLSLSFKNGGTVRALYVQEGAVVKKGQRLALVDETEVVAQVAQARAQVDKADRDVSRVEKLKASAAAAPIDSDNARTAADVAHATLASALYNASATVLYAPEDGRIDKRLVEVGEQVAPGRPIYAMSGSTAGIVARVGIVDRELVGMKLGDAAQVTIDALPGRTLAATIGEIATTPSVPAGTYEVELRLPNDAALVAGMTMKAELSRASSSLPVVPLGALLDADGDSAAVYVLTPGSTVKRVAIEVAYFAGDRVAVRSGLSGGEQVIAEGAAFVEPGRAVRPILAEVADARR